MEERPISILLVEDNPADARLIKELLIDAKGIKFELIVAGTLSDGIEQVNSKAFDVILLDLGLPDSLGMDTFLRMHQAASDLPILVLTGLNDETVALSAVKGGAQDYLVKGTTDGNTLARFISYAIERKRAERELRRSEETLRTVLSNAPILMFALDSKGFFTLLKGKRLEKLRIRPEEADEIIGTSIFEIFPDIPEILSKARQALMGESSGVIITISEAIFELWFSPMRDEHGKAFGVIGVATDITERKQAEEELTRSKERYQALVEETGLGMANMDRKGVFTFVNSTLCKMTGFPENELVGRNIIELVFPDDRKKVMDAFGTIAMKPRSKIPLEYRMNNKDGNTLYLYSKPAAIFEDRIVVGFTTYIQDITERKETEIAFQETQQMMKAVVETSPSMMVLVDPEGKISLFNSACEDVTGYKRDEVLGKTIEELFIPEKWKPIVRERFADPYSPKLLEPHENPWLTKKGEERLVEWRCTTIPSPKDDKPYILGIGIDITERRRLEAIMMQSQKMDSLGNLAAGIAHDFNNILTAILTHAELAKRQVDSGNFTPESLAKKLDTMMTAGKRAKDLTQKLLGLSRQGKYNPQNIDLNGVIGESVELLEKGFSSTIRYELARKTEAANYVYADATQLLMVVQNLVLNARDAMPDGGKITIATDDVTVDGFSGRFDEIPSGSYVRLTVSDAGTGIPDDVLLRIFEPFFTTKEKGKGTGLGLSMVWGIVKNHHGFIEVRTEAGTGSTFEIYLPSVSRKKARQDEHAKAEKQRKPKILVVDDEEMIRESAQEYLVSLGYDVLIAPSGNEALKIFKDEDIDLTITDLIMKEMDGSELFKKIMEIDPSAKVYVMSGYSQDTKVQGMIATGAAGFISKPFDLDELEKTVKFALSKK